MFQTTNQCYFRVGVINGELQLHKVGYGPQLDDAQVKGKIAMFIGD